MDRKSGEQEQGIKSKELGELERKAIYEIFMEWKGKSKEKIRKRRRQLNNFRKIEKKLNDVWIRIERKNNQL